MGAHSLLLTIEAKQHLSKVQWVARDIGDAFPGIESHPTVCGGEACIVRTRIPVWVALHNKAGEASIPRLQSITRFRAIYVQSPSGCWSKRGDWELRKPISFGVTPRCCAEDLANAWAYVRAHREEIGRQIAENEAA
jgi:hypothetical protein